MELILDSYTRDIPGLNNETSRATAFDSDQQSTVQASSVYSPVAQSKQSILDDDGVQTGTNTNNGDATFETSGTFNQSGFKFTTVSAVAGMFNKSSSVPKLVSPAEQNEVLAIPKQQLFELVSKNRQLKNENGMGDAVRLSSNTPNPFNSIRGVNKNQQEADTFKEAVQDQSLEESPTPAGKRRSVNVFSHLFTRFNSVRQPETMTKKKLEVNDMLNTADVYDIIDDYNYSDRGRAMRRAPVREKSLSPTSRKAAKFEFLSSSILREDRPQDQDQDQAQTFFTEEVNRNVFTEPLQPATYVSLASEQASTKGKTVRLKRFKNDIGTWCRTKMGPLMAPKATTQETTDTVGEECNFDATSTPTKADQIDRSLPLEYKSINKFDKNQVEARIIIVENQPDMNKFIKRGKFASDKLKNELLTTIQNGVIRLYKAENDRWYITIDISNLRNVKLGRV
ncbi:hypothetical protein CANARDRAFT_127398 [[Candida] arabinofermentans NRRL YB-2248]|uniref:Uncharacterized protein n=1 Tax=[Candida] arabinofermentans NRRL YB-2248 TaxID=983967 RepID=A0A1E4T369_9ASCO|nr:hypothetical protein CANARDRAFT_127398 [[Candida] arabinofermentans NRRL YB-2248]